MARKMKRTNYKGYIIDVDDLGRPYIYNTASPYAEDADKILVNIDAKRQLSQIKKIIDARIDTGCDCRGAMIFPDGNILLR